MGWAGRRVIRPSLMRFRSMRMHSNPEAVSSWPLGITAPILFPRCLISVPFKVKGQGTGRPAGSTTLTVGVLTVEAVIGAPARTNVPRFRLSPDSRSQPSLPGDGARMPYLDKSFDLVSCWMTLHEMPHSVRVGVLGEMARVTKTNGRILIVDYKAKPPRSISGWLFKMPILFFEIAAGRDHFRHYRDFLSRSGLQPLVSRTKLTIEREKTAVGGNIMLTLLHPANAYSSADNI